MATLAEQWIEEGMQKGIERGMLREAHEMIFEAISALRFEDVPKDIIREVSALNNRAVLKSLLRHANICPDLTGFRKALDNLS